PRAKPQVAATLQLASADAQIVAPPKPKPAPVADKPAAGKPETPADIINARGFWDDIPAAPQQATPAQVAALKARQALAAATDPQATASVSSVAYQALAFAPASASPVDRANVVAASAPIPRSARPASATRSLAQATEINTVVGKSIDGRIATATRLSAAKGDSIWLKIVMLSPSASRAMSVTLMGELDTAALRRFFVKPQAVIAMGFVEDPMQGLSCDSFSGSATAKLQTTSFVMRTAALR
ncbi:ATP-binding protein, partial [Bradyrhizobium genosp. SA-3]